MQPIPFIGPAYQSRSANYSSQRCVNWYLAPGKGKAPAMMIGCPGLTSPWATLGGGGGMRGMYVIDSDYAIMVCGGNVYKVNTGGGSTSIGSIADDDRPVSIAWDGTEILVVSNGNMYSMTLGGTTSTLIRSGIGMVDIIGDIFVATENDSRFYVYSDAGTTTFDPANIQDTNSAADIMVGCAVSRRTAYFFGTRSIEPWYESGIQGALNPLSRIEGGVFEVGLIAKDSLAVLDSIFWLGGSGDGAGAVWTLEGGAPRRISTPAIEYAISQWPDLTDAEAFTYTQEGHSFYVLSSVSGNETWVYDISVGEWHQRAWLHPSGNLHRIRPRCHVYFAGKNLVGDWQNGNVYEYDLGTYSDNGNPLPAIRACVALESGQEMQKASSFQLDMDTGVGLSTGQGSNPQAMLRWSKDGGKTWSNSLWKSFGEIGEYSKRCIWRRVGGGRRSVFEVTITDPVQRNVTGAYIA
jgi:Phage stabilisation protein